MYSEKSTNEYYDILKAILDLIKKVHHVRYDFHDQILNILFHLMVKVVSVHEFLL